MKQSRDHRQGVPATAGLADVLAWGWDGTRLANELIEFRHDCIEGLTPESQPDPNRWSKICLDYPDTWRLIVDGPEKIIGYWHCLPFTQPALEMTKRGEVQSGMITREMIHPLNGPGWYDFYMATVAVGRQYRGGFTGMLLGVSFLEGLTSWARKGILARELCVNFFTRDGMMLNNGLMLGLDYVTDHLVHGHIYAGHVPTMMEGYLSKYGENAFPKLLALKELYESQQRGLAMEEDASC